MRVPRRDPFDARRFPRRIGVGWLWALLPVTLVVAATAGYLVGAHRTTMAGERTVDALRQLFAQERLALDGDRRSTSEHLDAMALRIGRLQADLMRLDALGSRLVEMAKLDAGEFDFDSEPALGGLESGDALAATVPELLAEMDGLRRKIGDRELKLSLLEELLMTRDLNQQTYPAGRPVKAGWISSLYGRRKDPFTGKTTLHRGVDFAGKSGTEIIAVADGIVSWSGRRSGYGKLVEISHGNGYVTRYAHNRTLLVKKGERIHQGQTIAIMGHSGRATGTHLHFEVIRNDKTVNPLRYIRASRDSKHG